MWGTPRTLRVRTHFSPLERPDLFQGVVPFEHRYRGRLVILRGVRVPHDRIDLRVSQHRRQYDQINPGHGCSRSPHVPEIIQANRTTTPLGHEPTAPQ